MSLNEALIFEIFMGRQNSFEMTSFSTTDIPLPPNGFFFHNYDENIVDLIRVIYMYVTPPLIVFSLIACLLNVFILSLTYWLKKPSPTLQLSLSLAASDALAMACIGIGLLVNSWLPTMEFLDPEKFKCATLTIEAIRLGCLLVTVLHLLALSVNHYLGIMRPLHYNALMTKKSVITMLVGIWLVPIILLFIYFSVLPGDGFQNDCSFDFLVELRFRGLYSLLFFLPLLIMVLVYIHIFVIVSRSQAKRLQFRNQGRTSLRPSQEPSLIRKKYQRAEDNVRRTFKAVITTLMILGSYMIGWLPAAIYYYIVCNDCLIQLEEIPVIKRISLGYLFNALVILKALVNPIIYAARMHDVKVAKAKMCASLRRKIFCNRVERESPVEDLNTTSTTGFAVISPFPLHRVTVTREVLGM